MVVVVCTMYLRQEHYILELLELLSQPKLQRLSFFGPPPRPRQRCVGPISPGAAVPFCVPSNQPDHTLIGTTRTKEHNNHWTPLKITTKSVIIPWPIHALLSVSGRKGQNVKSHPNSFSSRSSGSDNLIKIWEFHVALKSILPIVCPPSSQAGWVVITGFW